MSNILIINKKTGERHEFEEVTAASNFMWGKDTFAYLVYVHCPCKGGDLFAFERKMHRMLGVE